VVVVVVVVVVAVVVVVLVVLVVVVVVSTRASRRDLAGSHRHVRRNGWVSCHHHDRHCHPGPPVLAGAQQRLVCMKGRLIEDCHGPMVIG